MRRKKREDHHTNIPRRSCYQSESQTHHIQDELTDSRLFFDRSKGIRKGDSHGRDVTSCVIEGRVEIHVHLRLSVTSLLHKQDNKTYPVDLSKGIEDEHSRRVLDIVTLNGRRTAVLLCGHAAIHIFWAVKKIADSPSECQVVWRLVGSPVGNRCQPGIARVDLVLVSYHP